MRREASVREHSGSDEIIAELRGRRPPLLLVLSGPSGVGKDTVLEAMRRAHPEIFFTVTATTRAQRPGEIDHVHYIFYGQEQFESDVAQGEFLEHAEVYGNRYGVPKNQVRRALARGQDVLIKVDVQGAATIRELAPQAVFIFLAPPSMEELTRRLRSRKTEDIDELLRRVRTAERELEAVELFDYVIFNENDEVENTVAAIEAIMTAERQRVHPRGIML
jgi:guanylate kinase